MSKSRMNLLMGMAAVIASGNTRDPNKWGSNKSGLTDTEDFLRNCAPPKIGGKVINIMNHPCGSRKARKARKGGRQ